MPGGGGDIQLIGEFTYFKDERQGVRRTCPKKKKVARRSSYILQTLIDAFDLSSLEAYYYTSIRNNLKICEFF